MGVVVIVVVVVVVVVVVGVVVVGTEGGGEENGWQQCNGECSMEFIIYYHQSYAMTTVIPTYLRHKIYHSSSKNKPDTQGR